MEKQKKTIKRRRRSYRLDRLLAAIPPNDVSMPPDPPTKDLITDYFSKDTSMKQAAINKRKRQKSARQKTRLRAEDTRVRRESPSSSAGPVCIFQLFMIESRIYNFRHFNHASLSSQEGELKVEQTWRMSTATILMASGQTTALRLRTWRNLYRTSLGRNHPLLRVRHFQDWKTPKV